ncbi:MAG TPA: serine hydrolase [Desulfosporosinus sp.]|nr:serine hydrolase [Desulfosporosinus sp.]
MIKRTRRKRHHAFAVAAVVIIITSSLFLGIFGTVRDSTATSADAQLTLGSIQLKDLEDQDTQLKMKSSNELVESVTIFELQKAIKENEEKQLAAKAAQEAMLAASSLEDSIRNFLGDEAGKVGLVYYDISSGSTISINESKVFTAASTYKVPLAMMIYDMVSKGTLKETDTLKFTESSREGGTGLLQNTNLASPIKVSTLVEYAIRYSDNIAANMLIKRINYSNYKRLEDIKLGITTNHTKNEITAQGAFNALKSLNDGANQGNKNYSKLIGFMKQTIFNDRISHNLPNSIVAHKIGNYGSNVHDIGIIYTERPYILAIYTNGLRNPNATISGISDIIYARQLGR